jgi:IclR family mhp operon transcriptional activator
LESVKTIRAVERAFDVLRVMQGIPQGATLVELQKATGLSGPTLLRVLKTLIAVKAVRRSTTDQRYRTGVQLQVLASGMDPVERLAEVAAPWLDRLCEAVEWPSDLAIHKGNEAFMQVLESSIRQSRFYVRRKGGRTRVNLFGSAAGSAFLAALTPERRKELAAAARAGRDVHNANALAAGDLESRVLQARRHGYAARHRVYRGGSFNGAPRDDGLHAIAVPVIHSGFVLGALNINWNRSAMTEKEMVRTHLPTLREAARGIAEAAAAQGLVEELPGIEVGEDAFWRSEVRPP